MGQIGGAAGACGGRPGRALPAGRSGFDDRLADKARTVRVRRADADRPDHVNIRVHPRAQREHPHTDGRTAFGLEQVALEW